MHDYWDSLCPRSLRSALLCIFYRAGREISFWSKDIDREIIHGSPCNPVDELDHWRGVRVRARAALGKRYSLWLP